MVFVVADLFFNFVAEPRIGISCYKVYQNKKDIFLFLFPDLLLRKMNLREIDLPCTSTK